MKEIVVIGTGIVGSFIAHECSKYDVHVTILEKHYDICEEVSSANSAIVHAGYDPEEGTLKGKLNKRGADLYPSICKQLHVDYKLCGAMVVACGEEEEKILETLYQRALHRNINVSYLDRQEILQREPNIAKGVSKAMDVPSTAVITPWEVCNALLDECILNGCDLKLEEEVMDLKVEGNTTLVITSKDTYRADMVINAAGLKAQHIMEMVEEKPLFHITPKRGQYFILSKQAKNFVNEIIYPVPTSVGKGVLAIPTVHGNTLLGPNSEIELEEDTSTTREGLLNVKEKLSKTLDNVPYAEVIHTYSGLRPCGNHNDFYIDNSKVSNNIVHCACIDSPGLASAPAIGEYVVQDFVLPTLNLKQKSMYHRCSNQERMMDKTLAEKQTAIHHKKAFGHIICRCEEISEQEVVDSIHRPCGARSIKGVKMRVRAGMGKCQGGFCEIEVAKILARELSIPLEEVTYDGTTYFEVSKGVK